MKRIECLDLMQRYKELIRIETNKEVKNYNELAFLKDRYRLIEDIYNKGDAKQ